MTKYVDLTALLSLILTCCNVTVPAEAQVYRDRVVPHWDTTGERFWYRNDLANSSREFILIQAVTGAREPAFPHDVVAEKLSEMLKRKIEPGQLPIDRLEFSPNSLEQIILIGPDGRFLWNRADGQLQMEQSEGTDEALALFLPPRPSGAANEETELVVINRLEEPVEFLWVDGQGETRSYARIEPQATHRQHTFAGHTWLFRRADGTDLGCATAGPERRLWNLTLTSVEQVRKEEAGRRRRRRNPEQNAPENNRSPDGKWEPFVRDDNLWVRSSEDQKEYQLSSDGTKSNTFRRDAQRSRAVGMDYERNDFADHLSDVQWAPRGDYLLAFQTTTVEERKVHLIESTPREQLQPILHSYPYQKPGDAIPQVTLRLFRMSDRSEIPVAMELMQPQWSLEFQRWTDDGTHFFVLFNQRGHQALRLLKVAVETGEVKPIIDETSRTFIHYSSEGKFELRWLNNQEILWASERTGWNHLWRYGSDGQVLNAITSGEWNVRRIDQIDESSGRIWFYAVGIAPGQDPYHEHFCRVNMDGTELQVLTEGDGTHRIEWSPDRRWMIDRYSRVDMPPVTELRTADGQLACSMETADVSELLNSGRRLPERFVAKGRDGQTDIWGIIHRPRDFDPTKTYAIVENIYAGPHDHHVPKEFRSVWGHQQMIADAGFIVVQIDGMGTAWRSRAFHDVCWKNLRDAGFPDRVAWIRAAAEKYAEMDVNRVGIYGGSAGGQNAMAALLWHHDLYKAAVADCGCHDNRMDKIWWNEQWMGTPDGDHYVQNSNMENAHLLQGKLMLVVGELDRNVDPATTLQVARKLVDADKDFDLVVVPGAGHGACETPWASRRRLRFFQDALGGPVSR